MEFAPEWPRNGPEMAPASTRTTRKMADGPMATSQDAGRQGNCTLKLRVRFVVAMRAPGTPRGLKYGHNGIAIVNFLFGKRNSQKGNAVMVVLARCDMLVPCPNRVNVATSYR